jgi:hypothetical protein
MRYENIKGLYIEITEVIHPEETVMINIDSLDEFYKRPISI